jgi:hypothetical protein
VADPPESGFRFSVAGMAEHCKENRRGEDTKVMGEGRGDSLLCHSGKRRDSAARCRVAFGDKTRTYLRDAGRAWVNGSAGVESRAA